MAEPVFGGKAGAFRFLYEQRRNVLSGQVSEHIKLSGLNGNAQKHLRFRGKNPFHPDEGYRFR
jgi:hypothetical protein